MNLVYALTANGNTFVENAKEAGTVSLLGMGAIFAVLALMWLVIEISHRMIVGPGPKKEPAPKTEKKPEKPAKRAKKNVPAAPAAPVADNGALIAAITAAISAAMAEDGYTGGFRVVSFKRASDRKVGRR